MTIKELAKQVQEYITTQKVGEKTKVFLKDAPKWVEDMAQDAHGDMWPDDWRYEFISDALDAIANDTEPDLDSLYPYTHSRLEWLSSRLDRYSYCDEAMEDFGTKPDSVIDAIAWGMDRELREVLDVVRSCLEDRLSELEDATVEEGEDV